MRMGELTAKKARWAQQDEQKKNEHTLLGTEDAHEEETEKEREGQQGTRKLSGTRKRLEKIAVMQKKEQKRIRS